MTKTPRVTKIRRVALALTLATLAVPLGASVAFGQYQVDRSGARDANPQVGSGGRNYVSNNPRPWEVANSIVEGTISGGKAFRGGSQSFDPRAFRGPTAAVPSSVLTRDSSGVTTGGVTSYNAQRSTFFWGDDQGTPPPLGLRQDGATPGYTPPRIPAYTTVDPRFGRTGELPDVLPNQDSRVPGAIEFQKYDPLQNLPADSGLNNASLDALTLSNYTTLNRGPFTGATDGRTIQRFRDELLQDPSVAKNDQNALNNTGLDENGRPTDSVQNPSGQGGNQPGSVDPRAGRPTAGQQNGGAGTDGASGAGGRALGGQPVGGQAVGGRPIDNSLSNPTLDNRIDPRQNATVGQTSRLLMSAEDQSAVYRKLQQTRNAWEQQNGLPGSQNEAASDEFNQSRRVRDQLNAAKGDSDFPTPGGPGGTGPGGTAPGVPGNLSPRGTDGNAGSGDAKVGGTAGRTAGGTSGSTAGGDKSTDGSGESGSVAAPRTTQQDKVEGPTLPQRPDKSAEPVRVTSLATGVKANGLRELLTKAEAQMRDGRFATAIDTYDAAEQVAPNNPLIRLGQAHAELGASYYRRAEQSLRRVLSNDPNLLVGQYDLRAFLGEDRLGYLDKELRANVAANPDDAGAPLLLAYIYYNTGNAASAKSFLALADQRAGGRDPFVSLLQKNWFLPDVEK